MDFFKRLWRVLKLAAAPVESWNTGWQLMVSLTAFLFPSVAAIFSPRITIVQGIAASLAIAVIALTVAAYRIQKRHDDALSCAPRLIATGFNVDPSVAIHDALLRVNAVSSFYHIKIMNRPSGTLERPTARRVAGRVQFFTLSGKPAGEERLHRWKHAPGPLTAGRSADLRQAEDLHPSGIEYLLDVAMKYDEDENFYTPNNDTALSGYGDFRDPSIAFKPGQYIARITLAGENVMQVIECRVHNPGKGRQLKLEMIKP